MITMKKHARLVRRRIVIGIVVVVALAVISVYMLGDYLIIRGFVAFGGRDVEQRQVCLLYRTDHQALLEACRGLSKKVATGDLKAGTYFLHGSRRSPEASRFPQPILDLKPSFVYIDENDSGRVMLEMFGGFTHFGVIGYTKDYEKPSWSKYGDKEIIPGLWYYDDRYNDNPEYGKTVEALRPRKEKGD